VTRGVGTLDREAVVCGPDGVAIFDALHRQGTISEAMLCAFDLLGLDVEDPAERSTAQPLLELQGRQR
jgi:hypothetical protein